MAARSGAFALASCHSSGYVDQAKLGETSLLVYFMNFFSLAQPIMSGENAILLLLAKLGTAILCGAIIGIERELQRKAAGLRTNILICVGSTLYMIASELILRTPGGNNFDPTRIAAQIVTGMGFIGAGSIMQSRGQVSGLTTAATLWVVAAIGIAIGTGYLSLAIAVSLLILALLVGVGRLEYMILGKCRFKTSHISFRDSSGETFSDITDILNAFGRPESDYTMTQKGELYFMDIKFCDVHHRHKEFLFEILRQPDVRQTTYRPV